MGSFCTASPLVVASSETREHRAATPAAQLVLTLARVCCRCKGWWFRELRAPPCLLRPQRNGGEALQGGLQEEVRRREWEREARVTAQPPKGKPREGKADEVTTSSLERRFPRLSIARPEPHNADVRVVPVRRQF